MAATSGIPNLGEAIEAACARAGIADAEALRAMGTGEPYRLLLANGAWPHFIGHCAIEMGLQGRPWNDCRGAGKASLRARFDAFLAERAAAPGGPPAGIEAFLDWIGVVPRRPSA